MLRNVVCPVSAEKVNSNTSRLTVFINTALMIVYMVTLQPVLLYIVTVDYGIRAFGYNNLSLLALLSSIIVKALGLKIKMIDKAQKVFASRLGFICALLGSIFIVLALPVASVGIVATFSILTVLDSVFNLCVGCLIYNHIVYPFYSKKIN